MAFISENNTKIYTDKLNDTFDLTENSKVPATRESVQKTFKGLTEMLDSNFATKQMNSTTIYDSNSSSSSAKKIIKMPRGFVLYDGVKFLVNIKQANTKRDALTLQLQLKDAQYITDVKLERSIDNKGKTPIDNQHTDKRNCITGEDDDTTVIEKPIYLDFNKTNQLVNSLAKGLYLVEYVKGRILTSSENLNKDDLTDSDIYNPEDSELSYSEYKVAGLPETFDSSLYEIYEGFIIEKSSKVIVASDKNNILKKIKIDGFNFQTPSSTLITKTSMDKGKLYFTFTESLDAWDDVTTKLASGARVAKDGYKGTTKALWNADSENHTGTQFYYNSITEKLYLPNTFFSGAAQIKSLNSYKIEFTKEDKEGSPIYKCDTITNPYVETHKFSDWKETRSAYIDSKTYSGQSRAVMTQLIKNDVDNEFYLGYFKDAKNSSFTADYNNQQRVYLNTKLKFNTGFAYKEEAKKEGEENDKIKMSKYPNFTGRLSSLGSIESLIRLYSLTRNAPVISNDDHSVSISKTYFSPDSILKIDSTDSYGLVSESSNMILSDDTLVMKDKSMIYAQNLDVKDDLTISKYPTITFDDTGKRKATETLEPNINSGKGLKFGRIYNFNSRQNLGAWSARKAGDSKDDSYFEYSLGIAGVDSRVYARRIDYNGVGKINTNVVESTESSIKSRRNLKTIVGGVTKSAIGDNSANGVLNGASLVTLETIYQATPKIAGTYDYYRGTRFWCPTSLTASTNDTGDVGVDELGNPNGDICTITKNFIAGEGDNNDTGSVSWVSRADLLGGQSSFGWINNTTIKVNSGVKADGSTQIISNIPAINSPGKLYNTLKKNANTISDSTLTDISINLGTKTKEGQTSKNENDILIKFNDRTKAGELLKAKEAEIQLTLGDSGVEAKTYGQSSNISTTSDLSSTSTSGYSAEATKPTKAEVLQIAALGQTITIPNITVNSKGIVTKVENKTVYIPTAAEILGYLNSARSQSITIKNSDNEVLATLDNTGELKISNAKCLQFGSLKVNNLEVESNLLVPGKAPTGTSHWKAKDDKGNDVDISYSASKRAIYAN